jgi:hypothetical protein
LSPIKQQKQIDARDKKIEDLKAKVADLEAKAKQARAEERAGNRFAQSVAPLEAYRDAAREAISNKAVGDLKPGRYLDATRKFAREAYDALTKNDFWGAKQAKHKELLNHFLYREAMKERTFLDNTKKLYDRIYGTSDKTMGKTRAMDLVNGARAILSAIGIGKGKGLPQDPRSYIEGIQRYNPDLYNELEPVITKAFSKGQNGYEKMSIADAHELRQTIETLWHRSRRDQQVLIDGKLKYREDVTRELNHRLNEIGPRKNQPGVTHAVTSKDKAINSLYEHNALFRRVEYWMNGLDGSKGPGPFTKYLLRPVSQALTDYRMAREEPIRQLRDIIAQFDAPKDKIAAPELNYTFGDANGGIGKYELLGAILHTGNDSNMRKLLIGRNWGELGQMGEVDTTRWDSFMKRMYDTGKITKEDMDRVQQIWDLNESMKPTIQKTYHDLFGYYFKEVQSHLVETPYGTYKGGYVPAKVDPFMVRDAQRNAKMEELESDFKNSMPSTGMGFTVSRVEYNQALSLDLRVLTKHIDDTMRFAMVQPAIKDTLSIMRDRSFSDTLGQLDPVAMEKMLIPWLNRSARQITSEPGKSEFMDKFWNYVRSGVGTSTMFGNLANSLVHLPNLSFSALQVEPGRLASSLAHYMGSPREMTNDIIDQSDFMKSRLDLQSKKMQQSIDQILSNTGPIGKSQSWFQDHGYFIQHAIWNVSDIVTWHGAFNQALDQIGTSMDPEAAQAEAVQRADAAVRMTQGSDNPEDLAAFQVGSPFYKTLIQFTSWFNSMANLKLTETAKAFRDMGISPQFAAKLGFIYMFGHCIPYAVSEGLVGLARGQYDKDEPVLEKLYKWFFGSQAKGALAELPGGSYLTSAGLATFNAVTGKAKSGEGNLTNPSASAISASTVGAAQAFHNLLSQDKQVTGKNVRDVLTLISILSRYPVTAIGRPIEYGVDVHRGAIVPTSTADAVRGYLSGSASEASRVH